MKKIRKEEEEESKTKRKEWGGKKRKTREKRSTKKNRKKKKSRELEGNKKEKKRKHWREEKEENITKTKKKRRTITSLSLSLSLCLSLHHKPLPIATTPPPWATVIDSITTTRSVPLLLHLLLLLRAPSTVLQVNSGELLHCLLGQTKMVGSSLTQSHKKYLLSWHRPNISLGQPRPNFFWVDFGLARMGLAHIFGPAHPIIYL